MRQLRSTVALKKGQTQQLRSAKLPLSQGGKAYDVAVSKGTNGCQQLLSAFLIRPVEETRDQTSETAISIHRLHASINNGTKCLSQDPLEYSSTQQSDSD